MFFYLGEHLYFYVCYAKQRTIQCYKVEGRDEVSMLSKFVYKQDWDGVKLLKTINLMLIYGGSEM